MGYSDTNKAIAMHVDEEDKNTTLIQGGIPGNPNQTIINEPWFVGKDVARALGYAKPENAIATHVDEEDKNITLIQGGIPGNPNQTIINESGLYSPIMSSKPQNATAGRARGWRNTASFSPHIDEFCPLTNVSGCGIM